MDITTVISLITALLSSIVAILAWIAKIRWSKEFSDAKDEIIRAKESQITSLENEVRFLHELSPMKIREYFLSVRSQLEEIIDDKEIQLSKFKDELKVKEDELAQLQNSWLSKQENVEWEINSGVTITLEGWANSIERRSQEADGHTNRTTELTIELAKRLGVPDNQLVHIRRGAILHDIGKMGVPESILNKQGKLSEEEWQIMRSHPKYAFDLLSPIEYLRPALDIPYCHHERWDGSGFPRGLKGEEIPLAARIFTVVDVWDALRTDRPYRSSWSIQKTLEYINESSGKSFDPMVAKAFIKMIQVKFALPDMNN
jgi:HD-GYP domain-containing protein (c-di-GMP phosphodiesterase class II)